MLATIYVDWNNGTILNAEKAEEVMQTEYYPAVTDYDHFMEWLSENYTMQDIYEMDKDEKEEVRAEFLEEMQGKAWDDFLADGYEKVMIEI